jgi:hypothetical protein
VKFVPTTVKLKFDVQVVVDVGLMDEIVGAASTAELTAANNNKTGKIRFMD